MNSPCILDTPCDVYPCLNNGACRNMASGYICNCQEGYNGDNCECKYFQLIDQFEVNAIALFFV